MLTKEKMIAKINKMFIVSVIGLIALESEAQGLLKVIKLISQNWNGLI